MKPNVGNVDRVVRVLIGLALASLVVFGKMTGAAALVAGLLAVVMLATAAFRICPLYRVIGVTTCASPPQGRAS